jgi:hypothetical protein
MTKLETLETNIYSVHVLRTVDSYVAVHYRFLYSYLLKIQWMTDKIKEVKKLVFARNLHRDRREYSFTKNEIVDIHNDNSRCSLLPAQSVFSMSTEIICKTLCQLA